MAETVNDNQDAQTVQADNAPTQKAPAAQQVIIVKPYVPMRWIGLTNKNPDSMRPSETI